ncbi:MAG: protein kinase [Archangium sp.]|nr:protein kinase [Archangium sp.]
MSAVGETVERAIVFEDAHGYRRLSALRCVDIWLSAFDESLLQVDVGVTDEGPVLFIVLRFREDRFNDGVHTAVVNAGEHAGGRVVALSDLEYQERGHFLSRFSECDDQKLGLLPDQVLGELHAMFAALDAIDEERELQGAERRGAIRHPVTAHAVVTTSSDTKLPAVVENVSATGVLIHTSSLTPPPVLREKVEVELKLPTGEVKAEATVVNVSERGVALQFDPKATKAVKEKVEALPQAKLTSALTVESLTTPEESESKKKTAEDSARRRKKRAEAKADEKESAPQRIGPYEILSLLGSGATADVFFARVAEGKKIGEHVAVKRLHPRRAKDAKAVELFETEAKTLASLKHANIVRTIESGVFDGQHCLVMEAIEGRDLAQILRRLRSRKRQMPIDVACYLVKVLCDALAAVHAADLVHGDVSPHNLFVSKTGIIKLGDFGLTRRAGVTNAVKEGRPTYLAPEALDGEFSRSGDLWAAAVTLYELLTLEPPFTGNTIEELTASIRTKREAPLREKRDECSGPLESMLRGALEKNRTHRRNTARAFADALTVYFHPVRAPRALPDLVRELFE